MNNYGHVLKLAKDLQEEFGNKLSLFESLQIAAQIHHTEVVRTGLLVRSVNESEDKPVALESIAMVLGYTESKNEFATSGTLLEVLRDRN